MRSWSRLFLLGIAQIVGGAAWAAADDVQKVEAQAQRYWAAEVQQDWGTVYDMQTRPAKDAPSRDEFRLARKEQGPFHYRAAQIGEVAVAGDLAWVNVTCEFVLAKYPAAGTATLAMWQLWRNVDGWRAVRATERDQWPDLPPHLRPAADEAAVAKRTSEYWQARVAQDWKSVYPYLPPAYREKVSLDRFLRNKARYLYFTPRVEWAEVKDDAARVRVVVSYKTNDPATTKAEPQTTSLTEKWMRVSGNWYLDVPIPPDDEIAEQEKTS
jgi:hypothetical protein